MDGWMDGWMMLPPELLRLTRSTLIMSKMFNIYNLSSGLITLIVKKSDHNKQWCIINCQAMVNILAREANISWHTTDDRNFRFCKLLFLGPSATQPVKCEVDWMNGC